MWHELRKLKGHPFLARTAVELERLVKTTMNLCVKKDHKAKTISWVLPPHFDTIICRYCVQLLPTPNDQEHVKHVIKIPAFASFYFFPGLPINLHNIFIFK